MVLHGKTYTYGNERMEMTVIFEAESCRSMIFEHSFRYEVSFVRSFVF